MSEAVDKAIRACLSEGDLRYDLRVAIALLRTSLGSLDPRGIVVESGGWDSYITEVGQMLNKGDLTPSRVIELRMGLEYLKADTTEAEALLGAGKMAMSAYVLYTSNGFSLIRAERNHFHDDIDPLLRKGVHFLALAEDVDEPDFSVEWDESVIGRVQEQRDKQQLGFLIRTAVRPTGVN